MRQTTFFSRCTKAVTTFTGTPWGIGIALVLVVLWAIAGPVFGFNNTWQNIINTGTQLVTFLMVFLIQSSQNRDTEAIQVKLDELIRATEGAHNVILDLEELEPEDIAEFRKIYNDLAKKARTERQAELREGTPKVDVEKVASHPSATDG